MGLLSSAQFFQSFVETKLDRHGILYRKVHETSDLSDTYIDEDGVRCRGFCGAYVDDLIVFSRSAEDHRRHLTTLFEVLSLEHLYLNVEKSHCFCKYVRFLGCVCGQNHIFMDGDKISAIIDMKVRYVNTRQLRSIRISLSRPEIFRVPGTFCLVGKVRYSTGTVPFFR